MSELQLVKSHEATASSSLELLVLQEMKSIAGSLASEAMIESVWWVPNIYVGVSVFQADTWHARLPWIAYDVRTVFFYLKRMRAAEPISSLSDIQADSVMSSWQNTHTQCSERYHDPATHAFDPFFRSKAMATGTDVFISSSWHVPACPCDRVAGPGGELGCQRFQRWSLAAGLEDVMTTAGPGRYHQLLEAAKAGSPHFSVEKERQLELDVGRTWPSLCIFAEGCGRDSLSNLLKAWIVYDGETAQEHRQKASNGEGTPSGASEAVGYVQGMNFIVMALLWHAGAEEAAFWLFVALVQNYDLRSMFEAPDMHGLKVRSFTIVQLVHQEMPDLSAHLAEHLQNSLSLLFTDWLLTLCAGSVPLVPLSHLWDEFFDQGYSVIYRLILARLRCLRPWLLGETDFGALVHLVKNAHVDFGPNDQPCPRPPRLPAFEPFEPEELPPTPEAASASSAASAPLSRRQRLLRRLVRSRDANRRSSLPPELGAVSEEEVSPRRPFCQSCEGAGSENCASWEKLVKTHLQAEVIDLARTSHYERMLAEPALCRKSVEENLREDNAQLLG